MQQRLGLLGRVRLVAGGVLDPLLAGGQRQGPVGAHLHVVVGQLHGVVVEGVSPPAPGLGRPDQRLVGVGEAHALEVRHRVGLAPDHVVEDPEPQVLHRHAHPEDVVVAADHPEGAVVLQHPARFGKPGASELVIGLEGGEPVPVVVDRVDLGIVRAQQVAAELQIVRRVGEDQVDALLRQLGHLGDAVAQDDCIFWLTLHPEPLGVTPQSRRYMLNRAFSGVVNEI